MTGWLRAAWTRGREGSLLGPVLTLTSGAVVAQAAGYAVRPALTRLFDPEAFGYLAFYLAASGIVAEAMTGRFEAAAMLPSRDTEARRLLGAAGAFTLAVAVLVLPAALAPATVAAWIGRPEVAALLPLAALAALGTAGARMAESWLVRRGRFGAASLGRVAFSGLSAPVQLAAGLLSGGPLGLIWGALAGRLASAALVGGAALRTPPDAATETDGPAATTRALVDRYRRFPLLAMPSGVLNTLSAQLPSFVLLAAFGGAVAGYFGVAYGTVALPMQLVGGAVAQVLFVRAAEARREGVLAPLVRRVTHRLALVGTFPLAALVVVGPEAFAVVFGAEWREAGVYARMLAPWLLLVFVGSPLSVLFDVLERQGAELGANVALSAARVAALAGGAAWGGARGAVLAFGIVGVVGWAWQTRWLLHRAGATATLAQSFVRPAALSVVPLGVLAAARAAGLDGPGLLGLLVATGTLYAALALRFGDADA